MAFGTLAEGGVVIPAQDAKAPAGTGRDYWCGMAERLAAPVLSALAGRRLREVMPVEASNPKDRAEFAHLEALGRVLCGIAPWLELGPDASSEGARRERIGALARAAVDAATDPASPDFVNFTRGRQPLVDAAFLAQAMLRAPSALWAKLEPRVQRNVAAALVSTRAIEPYESNWLLFAGEIEAFLHQVGEKRDEARLFKGLLKFRDWYAGDGFYGDGKAFHADYYNSFVIHPMLLDILDRVAAESAEWEKSRAQELVRAGRYATILERVIAPDGTYPAVGRSITYRCGAFHLLALAALRRFLPKEVRPAQAREALAAVIRRTLGAPGTWDGNGWLRIGLSGSQPGLGEPYISTGSLYLCSTALLPLGLPATDAFWTEECAGGSWRRIWDGENLAADHAIKG